MEISRTNHTRRHWIKQFMLGTAATLSGRAWMGTAIADISQTSAGPALVRLKAADIRVMIDNGSGVLENVAVLASPGGSVQFEFNTGVHPFTLNRVEQNRFVTLDSICTHRGCFVGRYKSRIVGVDESVNPPVPLMAQLMKCPCHGSRYDIEGKVFRNSNGQSTEPAPADLSSYDTSYDPTTDIVSISLPNTRLQINSISVQQQGPGQTKRMKLMIPVTAFSSYEIRYAQHPSGPYALVPFSTTASGQTNQTVLSRTTTTEVPVYVDATGTSGFFVVGLRLADVPT